MALLFDTAPSESHGANQMSSTDWLGFEKAVGILLEQNFGFSIEHRATRGKTDYGIDFLATKSVGERLETWVVQCKCYSPSSPVGPSKMRELLGAIADTHAADNDRVRRLTY
jgi:hypothetical protein